MATLKNSVIIALMNWGISATTEHDVPVKDAYKAYAFRHAVEKANKDIEEKRQGLVKSVGIENGQQFDERMKELLAITNPTKEQAEELAGMNDKLSKFNALFKELLDDSTELEGVKAMSYESYHALAKENKSLNAPIEVDGKMVPRVVDFFRVFESDLEGILWIAPKED